MPLSKQFSNSATCLLVSNLVNLHTHAQIVPEAVRTSVYAFDKCITGAIGALSTPLAGVLAQKLFGFTSLSHKHTGTLLAE